MFQNATISVGHGPGFDMALLAAATDTVVVGVGTFAWWGAYLSGARRKIIYGIQGPLVDPGYRQADFIPGDWIVLV